jgi:hypothetical protein
MAHSTATARGIMSSTEKISQGTLTIVVLATVVLAILGLWHNYSTLLLDYSLSLEDLGKKADLSNFYRIFYTMSGICVILYVLLFASGVQLIRRKTSWALVLLTVVVFEIAYFLVIGWLWAHSPNAASIAAASGVSSAGLM